MSDRPGQKIAIVGGGISGLAAAWLLSSRHDVRLFEAGDYFGGHTHTVPVRDASGREVAVDTGFIVFNPVNYPNLCGLFDTLGVPSQPSDMSFGVAFLDQDIEYGGAGLGELFARPASLTDSAHWSMLRDILRFNRAARKLIEREGGQLETLGSFLDRERLGPAFRERYLLPMTAAIWSTPMRQMLRFPAVSLARFMNNHGLLNLIDRPQWRTVCGGSWRYVERIIAALPGATKNARVLQVDRSPIGASLRFEDGSRFDCDHVVLACHADQALAMLAKPTPNERRLLGAFAYEPNVAVLHTDRNLMPRARRVWSAWNYVTGTSRTGGMAVDTKVAVTYWMNRLQRLETETDFFVSLNPDLPIDPGTVQGSYRYEHPIFNADAVRAQRYLPQLQGCQNTWLCGSYFGYGFHEDGLNAALNVAEAFGVQPPWRTLPAAASSDVAKPTLATSSA